MLTVFLGAAAYCVAAALQAGSVALAMLYVGRAVVGIGMAFGNQAAPVYLSEVRPRLLRDAGERAGLWAGKAAPHACCAPRRRLPCPGFEVGWFRSTSLRWSLVRAGCHWLQLGAARRPAWAGADAAAR